MSALVRFLSRPTVRLAAYRAGFFLGVVARAVVATLWLVWGVVAFAVALAWWAVRRLTRNVREVLR